MDDLWTIITNIITLNSCLNFKELLARNRRHIWSLSDSNRIRTHSHLLRKRKLNCLATLAKLLSCVLSTYVYGASPYLSVWCIPLPSLKFQIWRLFQARSSLTFRQLLSVDSECIFTLKLTRDMIITYSKMHRTDKYS